jgi:hypothetical protein
LFAEELDLVDAQGSGKCVRLSDADLAEGGSDVVLDGQGGRGAFAVGDLFLDFASQRSRR